MYVLSTAGLQNSVVDECFRKHYFSSEAVRTITSPPLPVRLPYAEGDDRPGAGNGDGAGAGGFCPVIRANLITPFWKPLSMRRVAMAPFTVVLPARRSGMKLRGLSADTMTALQKGAMKGDQSSLFTPCSPSSSARST